MAFDQLCAGDIHFTQGDDSLAGAIEKGLHDALRDFGLPGLPAESREDRVAFILGIARGIVSYLVAHEEVFTTPRHLRDRGGDVATGFDFPVGGDGSGRMVGMNFDDHVRDMIQQVLFTSPGERVDRPDFGCDLSQLVFAPYSEQLAADTEVNVKNALHKWLGDVIQVDSVEVRRDAATLQVTVVYRHRSDGARKSAIFTQQAP